MDIAVVIPAYNEEERLPAVLEAASSCPLVRQIIVVDDGSEDGTFKVAQKFGVRTIRLDKNIGKAGAVWVGLQEVNQPIVVLLDADLKGLKPYHIQELAYPVNYDGVDMTLGVFRRGRLWTDLSHLIAPWVSGQRAIPLKRIRELPDFSDLGYGLEAALNKFAKEHCWSIKTVVLYGVSHVMKEEKLGLIKAVKARATMYLEVGKGWLVSLNGRNPKEPK
ncbi:MAG: glycosyltransferase family 2 protein [Armatimonadetes bacterium]|nr:glycosyltransferase family 2 protein [Armatimonadota bacterium]MDW8027248.1 glycosyltransferase family 2 protein [Armatimonadota bacterium]